MHGFLNILNTIHWKILDRFSPDLQLLYVLGLRLMHEMTRSKVKVQGCGGMKYAGHNTLSAEVYTVQYSTSHI